jgi:H+/Cl- antiporter ClcA
MERSQLDPGGAAPAKADNFSYGATGAAAAPVHRSATDSFNEGETAGYFSPLHYESVDFDPAQNHMVMRESMERKQKDKNEPMWYLKSDKGRAFKRWVLICVVGAGTATTASFIRWGYSTLSEIKFMFVDHLVRKEMDVCTSSSNCFNGTAFIAFILINLSYCLCAAAFCMCFEPSAAGSGIPDVKCVLNGIRMPRATTFRTLVGKVLGIMFSVGGSLPVGKEGPMIHSGAAVADIVSQAEDGSGQDHTFSKIFVQDFRNDFEKRDFIACGAAAGVAAAFGAPIGGVLFSMEEGASFWSSKLTWRAFFCAMISSFTLFAISAFSSQGMKVQDQSALFTFGTYRYDPV